MRATFSHIILLLVHVLAYSPKDNKKGHSMVTFDSIISSECDLTFYGVWILKNRDCQSSYRLSRLQTSIS